MTYPEGSVGDTAVADGCEDSSGPPLSVLIGLEGMALGGCPINALDLGRTLRERGHRVTVFAIEEDAKVSLMPYAQASGFSPVLLARDAGVVTRTRQIRQLAKSVDADVTHVFGPWLGPAASAAMASSGRRAAIVTNWTMSNVFYTPRHTPVIVGTQRLRDELKPRHAGRVCLMEPPVDMAIDAPNPLQGKEFRREWGIAVDELAVVAVGRVDSDLKAESLQYAIQAIRQVDDHRLRLVIVGDGDSFEQVQSLADQVNGDLGRPAVVLTGALYDPKPAYDAADIALGMGGSALRALAHAKPLVVLGLRGFALTFEPKTVGYFYDVGFFGDTLVEEPVRHLASLVEDLLDSERREALSNFGLSEVRSRFALDVSARRLEALYRSTLTNLPSTSRRVTRSGFQVARILAHEGHNAVRGHV